MLQLLQPELFFFSNRSLQCLVLHITFKLGQFLICNTQCKQLYTEFVISQSCVNIIGNRHIWFFSTDSVFYSMRSRLFIFCIYSLVIPLRPIQTRLRCGEKKVSKHWNCWRNVNIVPLHPWRNSLPTSWQGTTISDVDVCQIARASKRHLLYAT